MWSHLNVSTYSRNVSILQHSKVTHPKILLCKVMHIKTTKDILIFLNTIYTTKYTQKIRIRTFLYHGWHRTNLYPWATEINWDVVFSNALIVTQATKKWEKQEDVKFYDHGGLDTWPRVTAPRNFKTKSLVHYSTAPVLTTFRRKTNVYKNLLSFLSHHFTLIFWKNRRY